MSKKMIQITLTGDPPTDTDPEADTVYIVVANYADDPHPHVEGVFGDEDDAKALMDDCRATTRSPHPVAWKLVEADVDGEVTVR